MLFLSSEELTTRLKKNKLFKINKNLIFKQNQLQHNKILTTKYRLRPRKKIDLRFKKILKQFEVFYKYT